MITVMGLVQESEGCFAGFSAWAIVTLGAGITLPVPIYNPDEIQKGCKECWFDLDESETPCATFLRTVEMPLAVLTLDQSDLSSIKEALESKYQVQTIVSRKKAPDTLKLIHRITREMNPERK